MQLLYVLYERFYVLCVLLCDFIDAKIKEKTDLKCVETD